MAGIPAACNTAPGRGVRRTMRPKVPELLMVGLLAMAAAVPASAVKPSQLPAVWKTWLEDEVYPIISNEERKAFLALETEAERQAFADRLWDLWAHERGVTGPTFRRDYQERLDDCRNDFGNTNEDRARVLLLHGQPEIKKPIECDSIFYPLEFWVWARLEGIGDNVVILFFKPYGVGRYRLWDPINDGRSALYNPTGWSELQAWAHDPVASQSQVMRPELRCGDQDILRALDMAEYWLKDTRTRMAMDHAIPPATGNQESAAARFLQFSTLLPKDAAALDLQVATAIGGRRGSKVSVTFSAAIPRAGLGTSKVGDVEVVQLDVTGEVSRETVMADRFRYAFTFPTSATGDFPVLIERELHPGKYHLRLKVQDANSKHAAMREIDFEVPVPELAPEAPPDLKAEDTIRRVAQAEEPTLALQAPEGEGVTGVQRFTALAGPKVAKVQFLLDGRPVLTKNRPPFEVELDLGPLPRLASVVAVALDAKDQELDRRQVDINVGRERFLVRQQPVGPADRQAGKVHASVTVNVPPDHKLARLELYWNEMLMQTLYTPPFQAWLPVKDDGSIGYLRALAVLDDGRQAEDVQFVNAPQYLTGIQVTTVELPVTVLDNGGKPVEGLKQGDFEVSEDGVKQAVSFFAREQDLPIRLGLVLDTSGSMEKTLPEVQRVVVGFLRNLLRPRDRAFVEAFNDRATMLEGFSADFGALERAMISLRADGETALYDATVYGLFQFSGVRGRKAMIILTDGDDNASRMDFDKTLDYARRSGVTIYTVGIDLPITKVGIRSHLTRLARTLGGDAFFLARGASLEPVYERINHELRSQYLLAYTSTSEVAPDIFRKVAVKVSRPKVEVRTISGYYPGG
jgi:Ca-activated chloride channel family protein